METEKNIIKIKDITFIKNSITDDVGRVFIWKGNIFRAINKKSVSSVKTLFKSGLILELTQKGLIPKSEITKYKLKEYGLIIKHEKIEPLTYPYEWSFSMFKSAAIKIIEINTISQKYGYQLKDCHASNIVFKGMSPLFVDLGSFIILPKNNTGWIAREEFIRYYYYNIKLWTLGGGFFARNCILANQFIPIYDYFCIRHPLLSKLHFSSKIITRIIFVRNKLGVISHYTENELTKHIPPKKMRLILFAKKLQNKKLLPFKKVNLKRLKRKVSKLKEKDTTSFWKQYHSKHIKKDRIISNPPRFDRIIEIMKEYKIKSLIELGGNQGIFSLLAKEKLNIEKITCTDYDVNAIDKLYLYSQKQSSDISIAVLNPFIPNISPLHSPPEIRFSSDAVVVLAVLHHLLLSQHLSIEYILQEIKKYTSKYIFLEFMPLGLLGKSGAPEIPKWYTKRWFKKHFEENFVLLHEEKLEENRILFIGKLK